MGFDKNVHRFGNRQVSPTGINPPIISKYSVICTGERHVRNNLWIAISCNMFLNGGHQGYKSGKTMIRVAYEVERKFRAVGTANQIDFIFDGQFIRDQLVNEFMNKAQII